jgi:chitinase
LTLPFWQWLFILMLAFFTVQSASAQTTWSLGYETPYGTQAALSDIDMTALTHITHVGGAPLADGTIVLSKNFATKSTTLISLAHAAGVKVLFDVQDTGSFQSGDFGDAVTNNPATLVTNIMSVVNTYGYDGVDIDWEKGDFTATRFDSLTSSLRTALGSKLLTAALSSHWEICSGGHTAPASLDRINVMAYDLSNTSWSVEWFNAPLYRGGGDVPWSVNYMVITGWIDDGCAAGKLNLAIPFYGYSITGGGVSNRPRAAIGSTPPTWAEQDYSIISATWDISNPTFDTDTHAYWIPITNGWLTFDNPSSIAEKIQYAMENRLGGWFMWNLNTDYVAAASPKHVLLNAVKQAFRPPPPAGVRAVVN